MGCRDRLGRRSGPFLSKTESETCSASRTRNGEPSTGALHDVRVVSAVEHVYVCSLQRLSSAGHPAHLMLLCQAAAARPTGPAALAASS